MLAISVDNAAEHFSVQRHSSIPVLPSEKKILCPCTSVLDSFSLDFWINEKPLHYTTNDRRDFSCSDSQCYVTALGFKTLLPYASRKGQHKFGGGQPCPLADIPFFHLCSYFIFNLPIPLRVFQNIIAVVPMSRFWANFLIFPVDGYFIHLF